MCSRLTTADILHQAKHLATTLQERQVLLGTSGVPGQTDIIDAWNRHLLSAVDAPLGLRSNSITTNNLSEAQLYMAHQQQG